jgi:hypothetical protein
MNGGCRPTVASWQSWLDRPIDLKMLVPRDASRGPVLRQHRSPPPEQPTRQGAGVLAAVDHDRAIDDHRPDARRILVGVVVGRPIETVAGSNRTTSAAWPSAKRPRSARPSAAAAPPDLIPFTISSESFFTSSSRVPAGAAMYHQSEASKSGGGRLSIATGMLPCTAGRQQCGQPRHLLSSASAGRCNGNPAGQGALGRGCSLSPVCVSGLHTRRQKRGPDMSHQHGGGLLCAAFRVQSLLDPIAGSNFDPITFDRPLLRSRTPTS